MSLVPGPHAGAHDTASASGVGGDRAALQRQLQGFPAMRFEPALESAYRDHDFHDGLKHLRISLAILIALVVAIVQVDSVLIPALSVEVPNITRLGVMVPILAIAFALTFLRAAPRSYPPVVTLLMTLALMGVAWTGLVAWSRGDDRVFVRLVIAIIAVYFVLGLRFRLALAANLVGVAFYIAAAVIWAMPSLALAQFLAMLMMASVISAIGAYNLEHARRTAWLEGRLLEELARRDGLTGIHNRRRLDEHLQQTFQQCLREHKPVALLFADVDHFKAYNDEYGHRAGDDVLKAVAAVHARFGRRPLDMAARFGGDEFALVLFDTDREQAGRIGAEIREAVRGLARVDAEASAAPALTVSIGIACCVPAANGTWAGLLLTADQALYAAKRQGRDRVHVLDVDGGATV